MSLHIQRPVDPSLHPLVTGNYRIATPAIESFDELVVSCLRYRVTGAIIYGAPRIGKTRSIEYVRLLLGRTSEGDKLPRPVRAQAAARGRAVLLKPA
jgi:hypothetical protein